jgi:hypothetical protein
MTDSRHNFPPATLIMGENIDPVFIKLIKRLQQVASMSANGLSVINISIFLYDGVPIQWTRPDVSNMTMLEPKGNSDDFITKLKSVR